ncbi:MAG: hypothetical protein NVSMB18_26550 [Acetobacteraceae bacterium]
MSSRIDTDEVLDAPATAVSGVSPARRHTRRLEDKLLVAFHHACDVNDLEIAAHILNTLELMLGRRPVAGDSFRRRAMESFVAAHERMWHIRHKAD